MTFENKEHLPNFKGDPGQNAALINIGSIRDTRIIFLATWRSRQLSRDTISIYTTELEYFCVYLDKARVFEFDQLMPDIIRGYLLELSGHRNPGGCHIAFRTIKTFLRWVWDEYELNSRCPITRVDPPKINTQPLPGISPENVKLMVDACHGTQELRDRAILACLLDTGCRASEFLNLKLENVNLLTGVVNVIEGKGGKSRPTFLGAKARKELKRYLRTRKDLTAKSPLWVTDENCH